jgi:hypothetical protein
MSLYRLASLALLIAALAACKKEPGPAPGAPSSEPGTQAQPDPGAPAAAPSEPGVPSAAAAAETSEATKKLVEAALASYEQVRAQLAADQVEELGPRAEALARAAREAAPGLAAAPQSAAKALADAATQLSKVDPKTLDGARPAFGEVSRHVVALLAADPGLRGSRKVMRCPMVEKGYQKWVQLDGKVSNPYYGSAMLECGGESTWD